MLSTDCRSRRMQSRNRPGGKKIPVVNLSLRISSFFVSRTEKEDLKDLPLAEESKEHLGLKLNSGNLSDSTVFQNLPICHQMMGNWNFGQ